MPWKSGLADAPRSDEILLALVMTIGPANSRPAVGGLKASEIKGEERTAMSPGSKARIRQDRPPFVEETTTEMGRVVNPPTRRAAAVAVIEKPVRGKICGKIYLS